jgi:hypothetical protein
MKEINDTESVYAKTGKRKRSTRRRDSDEIPFESARKMRKRFQIVLVKGSTSRSNVTDRPQEGSAAISSIVADCPPQTPTASSRNSVTDRPQEGSAASSSIVADCPPQTPTASCRNSVTDRPQEGSAASSSIVAECPPQTPTASSRNSVTDRPLEGSAAISSIVADCPPHRSTTSSRSSVTDLPLEQSATRVQKVEIGDGRGNELEPAGHTDDEHRSDGDSVKCPVCSVTLTTQEVATPDTCDHTFCAACLQEWTKNKTNCPVDGQMVNFILVRHHPGGEIIMKIPVEPVKPQSEHDLEDKELDYGNDDLGWGLPLLCYAAFMMCVYRVACALIGYILR